MTMTKKCPMCGKWFDAQVHNKKYCSEECLTESKRQWYINHHKQKLGKTKICPECGKKFVKEAANQKYCSVECRKTNTLRSQMMVRARYMKECALCGRPFRGGHDQKYCSSACRKAARSQAGAVRYKGESLCWICKKAIYGCSWSQRFEPIPGWKAKPVKLRGGADSYRVQECPLFELGW